MTLFHNKKNLKTFSFCTKKNVTEENLGQNKRKIVILTFDLFVLLEACDEQRRAVSVVITGTVRPAHAILWKTNRHNSFFFVVCVHSAQHIENKEQTNEQKKEEVWRGEIIH